LGRGSEGKAGALFAALVTYYNGPCAAKGRKIGDQAAKGFVFFGLNGEETQIRFKGAGIGVHAYLVSQTAGAHHLVAEMRDQEIQTIFRVALARAEGAQGAFFEASAGARARKRSVGDTGGGGDGVGRG
jgi:hypothetical protein